MRDIKRIDRILKLIETEWKNVSDERFGQFLINMGICEDSLRLWNVEDDVMEKHLIKLSKK